MNLQTIDFSDFNTEDVEQYAQKMDSIFQYNQNVEKTAYLNWRSNKYTNQRRQLVVMGDNFFSSAYNLLQQCINDNGDKKADSWIFPIMFNIVHGIEIYLKAINVILNIVLNEQNQAIQGVKLLESNQFRWGTNEPIIFTDNDCGELALRVCGAYHYKICDPVRVLTDYINADDNFSIPDYTKNLVTDAFKKIIQNYNGCSYTQLPTKDICNAIKEELVTTGFGFRIEIQMIKPTEESMAAINKAMQNKILNNL